MAPQEVDRILESVAAIHDVIEAEDYVAVRTVKEDPRALLSDHASANVACSECHGPIKGEPVKVRLDGHYHCLCCRSCERLYLEKYAALKARSSGVAPRGKAPPPRTR